MKILPETKSVILHIASTTDASNTIWRMIKKPACTFIHFNSFEDGLTYFDHHPDINLVILAVDINGESGFDLLKEIKIRRRQVPVFLISHLISLESVNLAAMSGCDEFLQVPFSEKKLTALVSKYLKSNNPN